MLSLMAIVISCAGDNVLADRLCNYLMSKIRFPKDGSASDFILHNMDEIEIRDKEANVRKDNVRQALNDFLASDSSLSRYSITEFDDILTIGIKKTLDSIVVTCEICSYIAADEDDLSIHRMTHGLV